MINNFIFNALLLVSLLSCTSQTCKVDDSFAKKFDRSIDQIYNATIKEEVIVDEQLEALTYLSAVTGIDSKISDIHHPVYRNQQEMEDDVKKWRAWYEENKCQMSAGKADSLHIAYIRGY